MEVHAHTHTARKKWTHYFWEFLMLFLAVFCGFLAENQREHMIEHQREKKFIASLKEDLCNDTASFNFNHIRNQRIIIAADTFHKMIQAGSKDVRKMYELNLSSLAGFGMVFTDRTSSQLKNSGAMRLIRNTKVADAIVNYWFYQSLITQIEVDALGLRTRAREKSYAIFDSKYYADTIINRKRTVAENAILMINDYNTITEFGNRIGHLKNLLQTSYINAFKNGRKAADSLITLINKEY